MSRKNRYIESGAVYELCFRAKESLPFSSRKLIQFLIQSVIARTQRDFKVVLCHDIWNGSHPHLIVVSRDSQQLVNFCGEVQKRTTDLYKRLLGLSHLNLWEGSPSIIKIGNLQAAQDRIAYLYANPAQDNLEDSIERFPGLSSWEDYQHCLTELNSRREARFPWVRLPTIPELSSRIPTKKQERLVLEALKERNKELFPLIREPNAWMKSFGVSSDDEAADVNQGILSLIRAREESARSRRKAEKKKVLGAKRLLEQPLLQHHVPKKRERKIFIITTVQSIRCEFIERVREFHARCRDCYRRWKLGELDVIWPAEAFKPPLPPLLNVFVT